MAGGVVGVSTTVALKLVGVADSHKHESATTLARSTVVVVVQELRFEVSNAT